MKDWLAYYMPPDYSAHGAELDRLNANVHWLMLILFVTAFAADVMQTHDPIATNAANRNATSRR